MSTLDAQRQLCESFIASQAGEGWVALATRYDDGGFSGGSLERPGVKRLMADIATGAIDIVVVYKIDRLSRSLIDFSRLLSDFDSRGVSFVSITQAFNTSHSMGRLTLNVLLSFAQFERELASERLRDKAAASRAQGLWHPGGRPFGYQVEKGRLIVDETEASVLRYIFRRYPILRSARKLVLELNAKNFRSRTGKSFTKRMIWTYLRSRLYRGDLVFRGTPVPGKHQAIVSETVWLRAQAAMDEVILRCRPAVRPVMPHPFKGRLFSTDGVPMSHKFSFNRSGTLNRYYIPFGRFRRDRTVEPSFRFRADEFDAAVFRAVEHHLPPLADDEESSRVDRLRRWVARVDIGSTEMIIALQTGTMVRTPIVGRVETTVSRISVSR